MLSSEVRRLLLAYPLRQRGLLAVGALGSVMGSVAQLLFPVIAAVLVDVTLHGPETGSVPEWLRDLNVVGALLVLLVIVAVFFSYLDMTRFGMVGERAMAALRSDAFARAVRLPMEFHGAHRGGEVSSWLLADLAMVQEFWIYDLRLALKDVVLIVGALAMMIFTSAQLALWLVLGAVVLAPLVVWLGLRIRNLAADAQRRLGQSSVLAGEILAGMADVKAAGREQLAAEEYRGAIDHFLTPALRGVKARGRLLAVVVALILMAAVFFMWAGSRLVLAGELTGGQLTQFLFFLSFLLTSAGSMAVVFGKWQRLHGAVQRLQTIFHTEAETLEPTVPVVEATTQSLQPDSGARAKGRLEFAGVHFVYPARPGSPVLRGLDFVLEPGQIAAVVGPSGAGKSTLAALLLRFYQPTAGEIRLDGRALESYPLRWVRRQIAWVPQDIHLTGGTLRENIAYGRVDATTAEIEQVVRSAGLDEMVAALPLGLETMLGERGSQLSGGQRQRVSIARALLRKPAVLILDEATSALDAGNEDFVLRSLMPDESRCTTLFITHRMHTVRACDLVLAMDEGRVLRAGKPDEVLGEMALWVTK